MTKLFDYWPYRQFTTSHIYFEVHTMRTNKHKHTKPLICVVRQQLHTCIYIAWGDTANVKSMSACYIYRNRQDWLHGTSWSGQMTYHNLVPGILYQVRATAVGRRGAEEARTGNFSVWHRLWYFGLLLGRALHDRVVPYNFTYWYMFWPC